MNPMIYSRSILCKIILKGAMAKRIKTYEEKLEDESDTNVAKFFALDFENRDLKRLMVTFVSPENTMVNLVALRSYFIDRLKSLKRNKGRMAYFACVEFGRLRNKIHVHFQFYFETKSVITKAYNDTVKEFGIVDAKITTANNDETINPKNRKSYYYVIKDHYNFDIKLAKFKKANYINVNLVTSSHKPITNTVIKYLYGQLHRVHIFKEVTDKRLKYVMIKMLVKKKVITIQRYSNNNSCKNITYDISYKIVNKVGNYEVMIDIGLYRLLF
jgi:hypothetical protein